MKNINKAVILAAGYGTRFLPFSKAISKTMLPIIDKPTIQLVVEEAKQSGCNEILIIVGVNKESIVKHFEKNENLENRIKDNKEFLNLVKETNIDIKYVEQTILDGTAGAVKLAKDFTKDEPFLLMFADDLMYNNEYPVSKQIIDVYNKTGLSVMACKNVPKELVTKYSSVEYYKKEDRIYYVSKIVEKPKLEDVKSTLSTLGRYVLVPEIYNYLNKIEKSIKGEKFITDAFDLMAKNEGIIAYDFIGTRYDIGNKFGYLTAVVDYALENKEFGEKFKEFLKSKIN